MNNKKSIVLSGVNLINGGTLSIFKDCLSYASSCLAQKYNIIALVNDKNIFTDKNIEYFEYPISKKSWLIRLYYEWYYFHKISKKIKPYLWFSLHDITPNIVAQKKAVYCHNPAPFYKLKSNEIFLDIKFTLFNLFYSSLYRINIKNNSWVIVQQEWLRKEFNKRYNINNIIVAHPNIKILSKNEKKQAAKNNKKIFFYPTFARFFKNIELICQASSILEKNVCSNYEIWITISGYENKYSRNIVENYSNNRSIKFIGKQAREKIFELYDEVDYLIFPSKLETWGMPISEFKAFKKPILVADLPYAHETIGRYEYAKFFDPSNPEILANYMKILLYGKLEFDKSDFVEPQQPFAENWGQLFKILLNNTNTVV